MIGYEVVEIAKRGGYRLWLRFADGSTGEVDIAELLDPFPGLFAPLRDQSIFDQVRVDLDTLAWPGEIDIAPEALYEAATGRSAHEAGTRT